MPRKSGAGQGARSAGPTRGGLRIDSGLVPRFSCNQLVTSRAGVTARIIENPAREGAMSTPIGRRSVLAGALGLVGAAALPAALRAESARLRVVWWGNDD